MRASKIPKTKYCIFNSSGINLKNPYDSNSSVDEEPMKNINNIFTKKNSQQNKLDQERQIKNKKKIIYKPVIISQKYLNKRYDNVINRPFKNVNKNNLYNLKSIFPFTKTKSNFFIHRELLINQRKNSPLQNLSSNLPFNNILTNLNYSHKIYSKPKKIKSNSYTNKRASSGSKKENSSSSHSLSKDINRLKELKAKYGNIYNTKSHFRNRSVSTKSPLSVNYFNNLKLLQINKNINLTIHSNSTSKKRKKYRPKQKLPSINLSKDFDMNISNYSTYSNNKNSISGKKFYEDMTDEMIYDKNIINDTTNIKKEMYEVFTIKNIITPDKRIFINIKYISLYNKFNKNLYNRFHKRRIGPEEHYTSFGNKKFRVCDKIRIYLPAMIQTIDIKNVLTKLKQYKKANQLKIRLSIINEEKYSKDDIKNGILYLEKLFKRNKFNKMINKCKSKNKKVKMKFKMRDRKLNFVKNNINNERYFLFSILDIDSFENNISYNKYILKKKRMIQNLILILRIRLIQNYMSK